jgi:hypothetical protein
MINNEENDETVENEVNIKADEKFISKDLHAQNDHADLKKSRNGLGDSATKPISNAARTTAVTTEQTYNNM